jgi:hypothetical protein
MNRDINGIKLDNVYQERNNHRARSADDEVAMSARSADRARKPARAAAFDTRAFKTPKRGLKQFWSVAAAVLIVGLAVWGVYSYLEIQKMRDPATLQQQAEQQVQAEAQALSEKVGKLMQLPDGEPVIATVSDRDKLVDQPFFAKAENGDRVLIYSESSVAIIYRESDNKIINYGPVAITADDVPETQELIPPTQ